MDLLESDWFFNMVERHAATPADRLVAVFTIAGQWLAAPGMREQFQAASMAIGNTHAGARLKHYLITNAQTAKASDPSMLAAQLAILLNGALAEEARTPGIRAIESAAEAAQAVVNKACMPERGVRRLQWAAVASVALAAFAAILWQVLPVSTPMQAAQAGPFQQARMQSLPRPPMTVNPVDMEAMLDLQAKFERGVCPAPHLIALPPGQMTAYMNVVNFRTPDNPAADRENLHAFLTWFNQTQAKACYYAPANGHTNATWR